MTGELRLRLNAVVVFAFCEGCAVLSAFLVEPRLLFRLPQVALGCVFGVLLAACVAPSLARWASGAGHTATLKLIASGACVGILAVAAMAAAQAWSTDYRWLVEALQRAGVPVPWHAWLQWWFEWLLPTAACLFIVAGAFAARLYGRVACSRPA